MVKQLQLREQQARLAPMMRAALPPGSVSLPAFGVTVSISTPPTCLITQFAGSRHLVPEVNRHSRPSRRPGLHPAHRQLSPLVEGISFQVKLTSSVMDPP